jgi:FMN phosphatase YigB (HAD superfamily)
VFIVICSYCQINQGATVIFDLEGVLIKRSILRSCWHIGFSKFIGLYNPFDIQKKLFAFLDVLEERDPETPCALHNDKLMPQILCDWLCGTKTTDEIKSRIASILEKPLPLFSSPGQKKAIIAITLFVFSPQLLANTMSIVKKGKKLLKRCYREKDEEGTKKNKVYILSNWDPESFKFLSKKPVIKKLFAYTDGIMISGNVNLMKPDPALFEHCFSTFGIDPDQETTIFIDDHEENIIAAQDLGKKNLYAIQCIKTHFKPIKKTLKSLGII